MLLICVLLIYLALGLTWQGLSDESYRWMTLAALAALGIGWVVSRRGRSRWQSTPLDVVLPIWIAAFAISLTVNVEFWRRSVIGLWFCGLYILIWYIVSDLLNNRIIRAETLIDGVLLAGAGAIGAAYLQIILDLIHYNRIIPSIDLNGTLGFRNPLATILVLVITLTVGRFLSSSNRLLHLALAIYGLLAAALLLLTESRGGIMAAASGLAAFALLMLAKRLGHWTPRMFRTVAAAIVIGFLVVLLALLIWQTRDNRERLLIYSRAVQLITARPLAGVGLFAFGHAMQDVPMSFAHAHAHNVLLHVGAELGLPGLVALLGTLYVMGRAAWQHYRSGGPLVMGAAAAMIGFFVHHLVDMTGLLPAIAIPGVVILAVLANPVTAPTSSLEGEVSRPRHNWPMYALLTLTVVLLLSGIWDTLGLRQYTQVIRDREPSGSTPALAARMQEIANFDPALPVYWLVLGHFRREAGDPTAQQAYLRFCALEKIRPHSTETSYARLQFFRPYPAFNPDPVLDPQFECPRPD